MRAVPAHTAATGGGMLNMSRGLGTALGVALVTLALHLHRAGARLLDGPHAALAMLAVAAVLMLVSARRIATASAPLAPVVPGDRQAN